jgi:hypothetical protein
MFLLPFREFLQSFFRNIMNIMHIQANRLLCSVLLFKLADGELWASVQSYRSLSMKFVIMKFWQAMCQHCTLSLGTAHLHTSHV